MTTVQAPQTSTRRSSTLVVLSLALGSLAFSMLQSLVAPALNTIGQDLRVSTSGVSWILTAYLLAASISTPVFGRLADTVGKRRVLVLVLTLLLVGTITSALAPNLGVLVAGRVVQGAAGAVLPLSISIVRDVVAEEHVSATIGLLSAIFGVGGGIGILVAGPILQALGWHYLFWLPAALIVVAIIGAAIGLPADPSRRAGRIDLLGSTILGVALAALLLAITEGQAWGWTSPPTLVLLALGTVALTAFVAVELRLTEPLIDIRAMRSPMVWSAHVGALVAGFAMFGLFVLVPTLLQLPTTTGYGFGATATAAGLVLVPAVITMILFSSLTGTLIRRLGPTRPMLLAGAALTASFTISAVDHSQTWLIAMNVALAGAGIGLALSAIANAVVQATPASQTAEALSTNTIARTIGSSVGTAVVAAALASGDHHLPADSAFTTGFWICAAVSLITIIVPLFSLSASPRRR